MYVRYGEVRCSRKVICTFATVRFVVPERVYVRSLRRGSLFQKGYMYVRYGEVRCSRKAICTFTTVRFVVPERLYVRSLR